MKIHRELPGRILKGVGGFYSVMARDDVFECKAKGIFRKEKMKPLVGDEVTIGILDECRKEGSIVRIQPRRSCLRRPEVSNVNQIFAFFSAADPEPNFRLVDTVLINYLKENIVTYLIVNKADIADEDTKQNIKEIYRGSCRDVIICSAGKQWGMKELYSLLRGKTTVFAGPSGVGKSSVINLMQNHVHMETGSLSAKTKRGKHTTRHSEMIPIDPETYIIDTPGFSSLNFGEIEQEEIKDYYGEFQKYKRECRFQGCNHVSEPDCGIKAAVAAGEIHPIRYRNYVGLFEEVGKRRGR